MNFLWIYLGEKGGGALMHEYVWEHIVSLYYRTAVVEEILKVKPLLESWIVKYYTDHGWPHTGTLKTEKRENDPPPKKNPFRETSGNLTK